MTSPKPTAGTEVDPLDGGGLVVGKEKMQRGWQRNRGARRQNPEVQQNKSDLISFLNLEGWEAINYAPSHN